MKSCLVVPTYNHGAALAKSLPTLLRIGLPLIVVDDGSTDATPQILETLRANSPLLTVLTRTKNGGKGAAIKDGLHQAHRQGITHALQIDADGQHNPNDISLFLTIAAQHDRDVICGAPQFDQSAPRARVWGREISNALAWLEMGSFEVRDVLCGFRLYPIHWCLTVVTEETRTNRMAFDVEAIVRLAWAGARIRNVPTHIIYPSEGVSHFRYLRDNLTMVALHVRLLCEWGVRKVTRR